MQYYTSIWFPSEKQALEFAEKFKGKVYPEDFLGGYRVLYPLPYVDTDNVKFARANRKE